MQAANPVQPVRFFASLAAIRTPRERANILATVLREGMCLSKYIPRARGSHISLRGPMFLDVMLERRRRVGSSAYKPRTSALSCASYRPSHLDLFDFVSPWLRSIHICPPLLSNVWSASNASSARKPRPLPVRPRPRRRVPATIARGVEIVQRSLV